MAVTVDKISEVSITSGILILVIKLKYVGVSGNVLGWFVNYLLVSPLITENITRSVVPGSVLGPYLFVNRSRRHNYVY